MNNKEHLLVCLAEELAEVAVEVSKCLRFTPEHTPACYDTSNLRRLQLEVMDVYAISDLLQTTQGVDTGFHLDPQLIANDPELAKRYSEKRHRTVELMGTARSLGSLI